MKNYFLLFLIILIFPELFSQIKESEITLQSGKTIFKIKENKTYSLSIDYWSPGDSINSISRSVTGKFDNASPSEIFLKPIIKKTVQFSGDSFDSTINISFPPEASLNAINKNNITLIKYKSKSNNTNLNGGTAFTLIGIFTATILAPLISTNFNTGEINSERYYRCVAAGAGFCIVSIPLFIASKEKEFTIKPKDKDTRRIWTFVDQDP